MGQQRLQGVALPYRLLILPGINHSALFAGNGRSTVGAVIGNDKNSDQ